MCPLDVVSLEEKAWFYLLSNYDVTTSVTPSRRSTAHLCCVYTIGCCFGRIRHFLHHLWCTFLFLFFNQNLLSLAPWPTPVFSEVSQRGSQSRISCPAMLFCSLRILFACVLERKSSLFKEISGPKKILMCLIFNRKCK